MQGSSAAEILRPYAWLAAIAFLVGFVSYLALGAAPVAVAKAAPQRAAITDATSGPASDEWNFEKHV